MSVERDRSQDCRSRRREPAYALEDGIDGVGDRPVTGQEVRHSPDERDEQPGETDEQQRLSRPEVVSRPDLFERDPQSDRDADRDEEDDDVLLVDEGDNERDQHRDGEVLDHCAGQRDTLLPADGHHRLSPPL